MTDILLRPIGLDDAGEVLTLQRAAYASEAQIYGDPFLPALTQTLDELRIELSGGDGLVAGIGHRIVAAVRWTIAGDRVHIGRLTVAPDQQGRGLGTLLLREAMARSGTSSAELFTGHLSEANLRLYVREGFAEIRRERLREGVELVYLAKAL
ncbi:GNAT family N-acetyltransferase [Agromyces sp. NPDC058110]|uniref:GNAT family N-acetyltransferase n=1 Tax=Agromyces sp. NPDC058110 TaxID=3346345 RepID=UPI0036DC5D06